MSAAERVREELGAGGATPAALAVAARTRAARAGRRRAGALAGVVCLAVVTSTSAALWPGWPSRLAAAGSPVSAATADAPAGPADPVDPDGDLARAARSGLEADAALTPAELAPVVPGAVVITASVVDPADPAVRDGGVTGGWCGDQLLEGVAPPAVRWWVGWAPQAPAPPGTLSPYVGQQVLRFGEPDAAAGYVEATAASEPRCFDSFDSTSAGRAYVSQGVLEADGSPVAVAASEVANAPGTFSVRALRGRGGTVVDLTVRLDADSADAAGITVLNLLDAALSRAVAGTADDTTGPVRPVAHRPPAEVQPRQPDRSREGGRVRAGEVVA